MSDIFDEYCRIAIEKGIVKKADPNDREDKESSSEYRDTIMALYGIDINESGKRNIIEEAHPESVIIAPSYDKLNGLVENNNERHDIMVGIVNKVPKGNHTQHRYAKKELLDKLISLGYKLDNAGEENLCVLADTCSAKLANEIKKEALKKEALLPLALIKGLSWGIGALSLYTGYKNQFGSNIREGILPDTQKAAAELTDVLNKVSGTDKRKVKWWVDNLTYLESIVPSILKIVERPSNVAPIRDFDDAMHMKNEVDLAKEDFAFLKKANAYFQKLSSELEMFADEVANMSETSDSHSNEAWKTLVSIWESVAGSDFSEARRALVTLKESIDKQLVDFRSLLNSGDKAKEVAQDAEKQLITLEHSENTQQKEIMPDFEFTEES